MKTCENCIFFKNNTCVNVKSDYAYNPSQTQYDVCRHWEEVKNEVK